MHLIDHLSCRLIDLLDVYHLAVRNRQTYRVRHRQPETSMEESKRELGGLDIITDRLVFAARALAPIAQLRDKWIGLASEMADLTLAAKKKYDSEMRGSSSTRTPEPAPKRHAGMTPRVIRGDPFFPGHQELVSSKAAGCKRAAGQRCQFMGERCCITGAAAGGTMS